MATVDSYHNINPVMAMPPGIRANQAEAFTGYIIDTSQYESVSFLLSTGNAMNPGSDILILIYESDVANFAVNNLVAADDLLGTFPVIDGTDAFYQDGVWKVGYIGRKRYLQLSLTVANVGVTDGLPVGVVTVEGAPRSAPTPEIAIAP